MPHLVAVHTTYRVSYQPVGNTQRGMSDTTKAGYDPQVVSADEVQHVKPSTSKQESKDNIMSQAPEGRVEPEADASRQKRDAEIAAIVSEKKILEAELAQVKKDMSIIENQLQSSKRELSSQNRALQKRLQKAESDSKTANVRATTKITELEGKLSAAESKVQRLSREASATIDSMTVTHSQQTAEYDDQIRQLMDRLTSDRSEGRWNPPPDDEIRQRLSILNNDIRDWSRDWAVRNPNFDQHFQAELVKFLADFIRMDREGRLPSYFRKAPRKLHDKLSATLLHAAVSDEIQDSFFESPFFCLGQLEQHAMESIFKDLTLGLPIYGEHRYGVSYIRYM
ncbi:hypothetical protein LTR64_006354 [Lithohypha guttulata]|uniref:uncharacterized protein n=1 Tax=Lithohypha guttulata TaxID=1690604 RepID=UPI002DDE4CD9|nr:hypothetical protein LTR51_001849 [Lithohypha guttulata]